MFLTRIHAVGLSIPPAEKRVYPGVFRPIIWPVWYHSCCINATCIPFTPTVLVRTLEAAILCCRLAWIHYGTNCNMFSLFLLFLLHLSLFLLPPFWFHTQKGEDHLSHAAEWSPSHSLQYHDRCSIYTKLEADPIQFLLVLINPPMAGIQSLSQPTESLKVAPRSFHRAWKPSHHSFIGRESVQAHHFECRALPSCQGWYFTIQPIPGLLILAYHNGSPFSPVSMSLGGESPSRSSSTIPPITCWMPTKFSLETWISRWLSQTIAVRMPWPALA